MESIAAECTAAKQKYESCFHTWYSEKFLKGDVTDNCSKLFEEYRTCLEKVLKEKKIDVLLAEHVKGTATPSSADSHT